MNLDKLKQGTRTTLQELETAAKQHAELALKQYDDIAERHEAVQRAEDAVREPLERATHSLLEISHDVNKRTEDLSIKLGEQTQEVTHLVTSEAERLGQQLDDRTREFRALVRERFEGRDVSTAPVTEDTETDTVDEEPDSTSPHSAFDDEDPQDAASEDDADAEDEDATESDTQDQASSTN